MSIIDADAHVIECEATWDYLEGADQRFRPVPVAAAGSNDSDRKMWLIDNQVYPRDVGDLTIPDGVRKLEDIDGRLRRMDELGIDIQVLYPTLFLATLSDRPEVQVALARSYNRWVADRASRSGGRLRWVVVIPTLSISDCLAEMEFGKANGACGVMVRGIELDRSLADPYFFPLYERAQQLDLAFCVHTGNGNIPVRNAFFGDPAVRVPDVFYVANTPLLTAFHQLIVQGIPERFPTLRWGFIEAGAQWVPYMIGEAIRRQKKMSTVGTISEPKRTLRDKRFWVTCRTDNDLPYLLDWSGDDHLIIGTDYGHKDAGTEVNAFQMLREAGTVSADILDRIMGENARALYGL